MEAEDQVEIEAPTFNEAEIFKIIQMKKQQIVIDKNNAEFY